MNRYTKQFLILTAPAILALLLLLKLSAKLDAPASEYPFEETLNAPLTELTSELTVTQKFVSEADDISGITLLVGTFGRKNKGKWTLELFDDESGAKLATKTINVKRLEDNKKMRFSLPEVRGVKGKKLTLAIKSDSAPGKSATLYMNKRRVENSSFLLNGKETDGTLYFQLRSSVAPLDFLDKITQFRPGFIKGAPFYALVFLHVYEILLVSGYVLWAFARPKDI